MGPFGPIVSESRSLGAGAPAPVVEPELPFFFRSVMVMSSGELWVRYTHYGLFAALLGGACSHPGPLMHDGLRVFGRQPRRNIKRRYAVASCVTVNREGSPTRTKPCRATTPCSRQGKVTSGSIPWFRVYAITPFTCSIRKVLSRTGTLARH